jgi:hypothetical protein
LYSSFPLSPLCELYFVFLFSSFIAVRVVFCIPLFLFHLCASCILYSSFPLSPLCELYFVFLFSSFIAVRVVFCIPLFLFHLCASCILYSSFPLSSLGDAFILTRRLSLITLQQCTIISGASLLCCKIYPKDIIEIGHRRCEYRQVNFFIKS